MEVFQTRILQLNLCLIITFLTYLDYSKSSEEPKIRQHINKTVSVGETVTLHCNKTTLDDDFTWTMNNSVIFRQIPGINRTFTNFSSNRIYINPAAPRELQIHQIQASDAVNYTCYPAEIRWTLTVTEHTQSSLNQMWLNIIIISCIGVILFSLIITISVCIHRRCKNTESHRETGQDFSQAPVRRRIQTQSSQYFERYNSVYGQL